MTINGDNEQKFTLTCDYAKKVDISRVSQNNLPCYNKIREVICFMIENLFSGKIICKDCKKKHKGKVARKRRVYICSTKDRGLGCSRNMVTTDQLMDLLELRFKRLLTKEEIDLLVDYILVSENSIEIFLYDDKPIKLLENYAQF